MAKHKKSVQLTCAQCGILFLADAYEVKKGRKYCSRECGGIGRTVSIAAPCAACGAMITRNSTNVRPKQKHLFCDRECKTRWMQINAPKGKSHYKYNSVEVQCNYCGKAFALESKYASSYKTHYCSRTCVSAWQSREQSGPAHPRWKGGDLVGYRGPNWGTQSADARKRDGYKCKHCGISQKKNGRKLDVHHVIPFRSFGYVPGENDNYLQANALTNLLTLCPSCHQLAEAHRIPLQPFLL